MPHAVWTGYILLLSAIDLALYFCYNILQRVSGEVEDTSSSPQAEAAESSQQPKRPLKKGNVPAYLVKDESVMLFE